MNIRSALDDSPVLALEHNITAAFESFQGNLGEIVEQGLLDRELLLEVDASPPRTPSVSRALGGPAQIRIHVALLELLWACIYSWMVLYEETVQKAQLQGQEIGSKNSHNEQLVARAERLWAWARGLRSGYTRWPVDAPSPRTQADESESYYVGKANYVFERATSFLLLHEYAHVTQGHLDFSQPRVGSDLAGIQLENEADQRAFESLIGQGLADEEKAAEAWAVLSSMLCSLYSLRDFRLGLLPGTHPALHHRLGHLVRSLHFQSAQYKYYFHLLCRVMLHDAFPRLAQAGQRFEDAEESFQAALDELDVLAASSSP